jgi:thiamine-monophosphate kinase
VGKRRKISEFEIIERYFAPLAAAEPGAFGLIDDAALLDLEAGRRMVVTTDTLIAGVHFRPLDAPEDIAAKVVRVNLSDLAAMGAVPKSYTLSAALTDTIDEDWLARFSHSLASDQARYGITLVGGDTVATPGPLSFGVTAFGSVEAGRELRRTSARPGDLIFVSGTIGDAALGLLALRGTLTEREPALSEFLIDRYLRPQPRTGLGCRLAGRARAAADISDGLVADLGHITQASRVAAVLEASLVPLSPAARAAVADEPALMETVLTGGDDYELIFTAPPQAASSLALLASEVGVALTRVGIVAEENGTRVRVIDQAGQEMDLSTAGYRHF